MKKILSVCLILASLLSCTVFNISAEKFNYTSISTNDEWYILNYINEFRLQNGKEPLTMLVGLQDSCRVRSNELLSGLSHYRPNGNQWYSILDEKAIAYDTNSFELIASNFDDVNTFAAALLESQYNCEKLLSDISHIGVSYSKGGTKLNKSAYCIIGITCNDSYSNEICNADDIHLNYGASKDKINVVLKNKCNHGYGYFPVISDMISSYDPNAAGTSILNVKFKGENVPFKVVVDYLDSVQGTWYYDAVLKCTDNGYFSGTGKGLFSPSDSMTREMFVTVLGRFANVDTSAYTSSSFTDVESGQWYSTYIEWAAKHNIVSGNGKGKFNGKKAISRQEICVIICNYVETFDISVPQINTQAVFADAESIDSWAAKQVSYCQTRGLLNGNNKNEFMPLKTATRAEVAVILENFDKAIK